MAHKGEKENGSHYSSSGATKNVYSKKKRTSFVNDNAWWEKLSEGFKNLKRGGSYSPQKMVRRMEFREGLSKPKAENKVFSKAELSSNTMTQPFRGPGLLSRVEIGEKAWEKERADAGNFQFEKKYLKQFSQGFDNLTKSYKGKPTMVDNQGNLQKPVKSEAEMRANQNRVIGSDAQWKKLRQEHWNVFKDPNKPKDYWEKKRRSDRESGYGSY